MIMLGATLQIVIIVQRRSAVSHTVCQTQLIY
jgi:hypothetical protein